MKQTNEQALGSLREQHRHQRMKLNLLPFVALLLGITTSPGWENGAARLMTAPRAAAPPEAEPPTCSSFDRPNHKRDREKLPAGFLKFEKADLQQVLDVYQQISGRTVLRLGSLPAAKFSLVSQTPLTRREALQALDTALAMAQIVTLPMGTRFVRVTVLAEALSESGPVINLPPDQLPESKSFMVRFVPLKYLHAQEALPLLYPFQGSVNNIVALRDPGPGLLILRDYSINIRGMLEVLKRADVKSAADRNPTSSNTRSIRQR